MLVTYEKYWTTFSPLQHLNLQNYGKYKQCLSETSEKSVYQPFTPWCAILFYSFFFLILKPWITLSSPNIPRTFISVEPHLWNFLLDSKHFFLFLFSAVIAKQFHQVASSAQIIPFLCTEGHSSFCWAVPWSLVIVLMSVLLCRTPVFQTQRKVYFHLFCT